MNSKSLCRAVLTFGLLTLATSSVFGQIGRRFPSEKKVVVDPVTDIPLTFLTSTPAGDSKIYQTHNQWTSDGKWLVFRSARAAGQAFAVNEESGAIVQLTETGYTGMLCISYLSMKLYFMRDMNTAAEMQKALDAKNVPGPGHLPPPPTVKQAVATAAAGDAEKAAAAAEKSATAGTEKAAPQRPKGPFQIIETDLAKLFADSERGKMKPASAYERVCAVIPEEFQADDLALDAKEDRAYFRASGGDVGQRLAPGTKIEENYGLRKMGAGPGGLRSVDLRTGEIKFIVDVPFQIGHVQSNPFASGEIVFCWETGGKAPQRTWTVNADGTGLRPLYPEASYDWVTHEAIIGKDEVAIAILGHRAPGSTDEWGSCGTREYPTGLGIVNLRTKEMRIAGQTHSGSGLWHVGGSSDGRWAVGDDFTRNLYLIDRHTDELILLSTGHKETAADHPHPTFNADGTKVQIQSAMLSEDNRSLNICIIPIPQTLLDRKYDDKASRVINAPAAPRRQRTSPGTTPAPAPTTKG